MFVLVGYGTEVAETDFEDFDSFRDPVLDSDEDGEGVFEEDFEVVFEAWKEEDLLEDDSAARKQLS